MPYKFENNMGAIDRLIRSLGGVILCYFGLFDTSVIDNTFINILMVVIGVANLLAAISSYCPLYTIAGFNTRTDK